MTHNQTTANKAAKARVEPITTRTLSLEHSAALIRHHCSVNKTKLSIYWNRVMAADLGWSHFLWAGTLIMFLQMKFKFSKNFEWFMILHKISRFFQLDCYAFPVKVCILNQLQLQRSPYQKIKGLLKVLEKLLIGLPDFSCFKFFIFHCFKPVTSCVVQEWDPPTTASSNANPRKLISLAYSCKLHWCR